MTKVCIKIYIPRTGYYSVVPTKELITNFILYNFGEVLSTVRIKKNNAAGCTLLAMDTNIFIILPTEAPLLMVEIIVYHNPKLAQKIYNKLAALYYQSNTVGEAWAIEKYNLI